MKNNDDLDPLKGAGSTPIVCDSGGQSGCVCGGGVCVCSDGCVCLGKGGIVLPRSLVVAGKCRTCLNVTSQGESAKPVIPPDQLVTCRGCKQDFHAYNCTGTDTQYCLKSLCKTFTANSTSSNVVFFCDPCLTKFELNESNADMQRVTRLASRMVNFESLILSKLELLSSQINSGSADDKVPPPPILNPCHMHPRLKQTP